MYEFNGTARCTDFISTTVVGTARTMSAKEGLSEPFISKLAIALFYVKKNEKRKNEKRKNEKTKKREIGIVFPVSTGI
jgi:hypothetical protein